ncbi:hypothetical protein ACN38_g9248 [Penicillium nordicum]|uniref:Uncharacterized protein n=1 Tax=Penicillium nordicum TaxID=229535 RepID=A0A0M8NYI8_9EURO|nr:hypothetical protein ACN38_g9248 [Penicillium nordicum]
MMKKRQESDSKKLDRQQAKHAKVLEVEEQAQKERDLAEDEREAAMNLLSGGAHQHPVGGGGPCHDYMKFCRLFYIPKLHVEGHLNKSRFTYSSSVRIGVVIQAHRNEKIEFQRLCVFITLEFSDYASRGPLVITQIFQGRVHAYIDKHPCLYLSQGPYLGRTIFHRK